VDDIAQEAFLAAFTHLSQLRDPRRFGSWLCRIAANRVALEARNSRKLLSLPEDLPATPSNDRGDIASGVMEQVQRLPIRLREPLVMFYINGYSAEDVAGLLGVPHGTVRRRLHEARKALRHTMEAAMVKEIKRSAPRAAFAEKVWRAFEVFHGRDPESGASLVFTISSDDPGYTRGRASQAHQEILELFAKGQYEFVGTKKDTKTGTTVYLYRFGLSDGQQICHGCSEPVEQFMERLSRAIPKD
jgi:RNA polymerase sigma-70 factor (ECF subfamily)